MLRLLDQSLSLLCQRNILINVQQLRWRRKPRWLNVAKSKQFKVVERTKEMPEEREQLQKLHRNYRTQLNCIRAHFNKEVTNQISTLSRLSDTQEENTFLENMKLNEIWNANIAIERENRLSKEKYVKENLISEKLEKATQQMIEDLDKVNLIVRLEKANVENFNTKEGLDKAIENAFLNPVEENTGVEISLHKPKPTTKN